MTVLRTLMLKSDATDEDPGRVNALAALNVPLMREGFEAYYGDDDHLYVRHIASRTVSSADIPSGPRAYATASGSTLSYTPSPAVRMTDQLFQEAVDAN